MSAMGAADSRRQALRLLGGAAAVVARVTFGGAALDWGTRG